VADRKRFEAAKKSMTYAFERRTSLAEPFLTLLPIEGAAVSVLRGPIGQWTVSASDDTAGWLDELQFTLGEGPCWDAMDADAPVSAPDIRSGAEPRWPAFTNAVNTETGVGSLHAFPLVLGSLEIGAVDVYSSRPGELSAVEIADGSALAAIATWQVLRTMLDKERFEEIPFPASRREVHQATGMVLVQLGVSVEDAELIIRAHAFATGSTVVEVAADIVARRLDFSERGRGTAPGSKLDG